MTKEEFLNRCATAWEAGLITPETLRLLESWADSVMRLEGGQINFWSQFIEAERRRTDSFHPSRTLANDHTGYKIIQLVSVFTHPCQKCAEDPNAWHTRPKFCPHKEK